MNEGLRVFEQMRAGVEQSGRSLKSIADAAAVGYASVHRLANRDRDTMTIATAVKILTELGLRIQIVPIRKQRRTAKGKA